MELKRSPGKSGVNDFIDTQKYGDIGKLFRVTAYVLLAVEKLKGNDCTLTVELLERAELIGY